MNHMRSRVPEKTAERILDYLSDQQAEMVDFLRQLTLAESPSDVPASQAEVLQLLSDFLGDIEFVTERIPGRTDWRLAVGTKAVGRFGAKPAAGGSLRHGLAKGLRGTDAGRSQRRQVKGARRV